jgi:hypothetical protein
MSYHPNNINGLTKEDDNFFSLPEGFASKYPAAYVNMTATGLKPSTRYKVMIDNYPGNAFEDITDFCRADGESIRDNTHRIGSGRQLYLKSSENGELFFKVRPYGTNLVTTTGDNLSGTVDWSNFWETDSNSILNDKGRENVRLIEYSRVNNPDTVDKIKTTNIEIKEDADSNGIRYPINIPATAIAYATLPKPGKVATKPLPLPQPLIADIYQTFYVDSKSVDGSTEVDLTDITLYFRKKPREETLSNAIKKPGARLVLLYCDGSGAPITTSRVLNANVRVSYSGIQASPLATTGTVFSFEKGPVTVKTNAFYAIAVVFENPNFELWRNVKGDLLLNEGVRTDNRSSGTSKSHKGDTYFPRSASSSEDFAIAGREGTWEPNVDIDLKFDVHVAEYTVDDVDLNLVLKDYEFFKLSNTSSNWAAGEIVYKDTTNETGTVTIAAGTKKINGTTTTFTSTLKDGDKIVVIDSVNPTAKQVFTVTTALGGDAGTPDRPASDTVVYVKEYAEQALSGNYKLTVCGRVDGYNSFYDTIRLVDSSVNTTQYTSNNDLRFAPGDTIVGVESGNDGYIDNYNALPLSVFRTNFNGKIPESFKPTTSYRFTYYDPGSNTYILEENGTNMYLNSPNYVKKYRSNILSRSNEVADLPTYSWGDSEKSAVFKMRYTYQGRGTRSYTCPSFNLNELSIVSHRWQINNDSTDEHTNNGSAVTRHISKILSLGGQKKAEDIKVIANIYRPRNTSIEIYAKFLNTQDNQKFEDKTWTKLRQKTGNNVYSRENYKNDFFSAEWMLPNLPVLGDDIEGQVTTVLDSSTLTVSNANTTELDALSTGEVISVYNPLFLENYQVSSIASVNSAAGEIVLNEPIANSSLVGDGLTVTKFNVGTTAFRNPQNESVLRYYDSTGAAHDKYDQVAIKIVLLADSPNLVPVVNDYRCIAVSV